MIRYTRHARNSMRLYGILESEVEETLKHPDRFEAEVTRSVAIKRFTDRFEGFPLKVVYVVENKATIVISTYPYEKGF
ncbi:MAG TPA: DUF4258 domain-containing protein [Anaerolineales bacterium]|nr:DUF4258 domain-containing protein [Anaerolineales bacterium]